MALDPSEKDLLSIAEVTGLDLSSNSHTRQVIVNAWKAHNGNLDNVVVDYFTDQDQFLKKHTWDEQAFGAGRDGDLANWHSIPSFQVHSADNQVIEGQPAPDSSFMAPTRPPSRTQSPLGRLIDYATTPDFSSLSAAVAPTSFIQEDVDLQRALAESARMSEIHSPQETGVANGAPGGSPVFGPATREQYDPSQWAMVATAASSRRGEEPGPRDRKRAIGAPAFLRCRKEEQWNKHQLGPILTVLHSIPAVRNGLLISGGGGQQAINYGHNKEWWKGQQVENGAGQNLEEMSKYEGEAAITQPDSEQELHRLMAFLDLTERSYATADVLLNFGSMSNWGTDVETLLFHDLKGRNEFAVWRPMWTTAVAVDAITGEVIPEDSPNFAVLDASHSKERFLQVETTYDAIDTTLWPHAFHDDENANDEPRFAIISRPADVLVIRISGLGLQKSLKLLPVIYIDRYLEKNKDLALKLQGQIRAVNEALAKGTTRKGELLQFCATEFSNPLDPRELSQKVIETNRTKIAALQSGSLWRKHQEDVDSGEDADFSATDIPGSDQLSADEQEAKSHYEAEITLHEHKLANIDRKMKKLDGQMEMCQALLKKLRGQLTDPCEENKWNPSHKYTLRGVVTGPQTLYLCKQPEENLIVFEDNATSEQWWRLAYLPDSQEPLVVEKTTLEIVEESLLNETDKPILIYANDAAMSEIPAPLSDSLATFVKHDNRLFKQELIEETPRRPTDNDRKRMSADGPSSPPKRRARASSINSMDTNRASAGASSWSADDQDSLPDKDQVPELDHVEHVEYGSPARGPVGGHEGAFSTDEGDERLHGQHEQDGALGTEMVQLAISRPMGEATGPVRGTESSFQTNYIADWDNPDGKPLMVKQAKERKALDD